MLLVCNCFYADSIIFFYNNIFVVVRRGWNMACSTLYYHIKFYVAFTGWRMQYNAGHSTVQDYIPYTMYMYIVHNIIKSEFEKRTRFSNTSHGEFKRLFLDHIIRICFTVTELNCCFGGCCCTHIFFKFHFKLLYFWSVNQSSLIQRI